MYRGNALEGPREEGIRDRGSMVETRGDGGNYCLGLTLSAYYREDEEP